MKIWCLTVDCLLQILSGKSYLSQIFRGYHIRTCLGDEFHQVDLAKLYALSLFCNHIICFYDPAQKIDFYKYEDQLAEQAYAVEKTSKCFLNW